MLRGEFGSAHYVMVVGLGEAAAVRLGQSWRMRRGYGDSVARIPGRSGADPDFQQVELDSNYPVISFAELPDLLRSTVIDEIIFAVDSRRLAELEEVFLLCDEEGVRKRAWRWIFSRTSTARYIWTGWARRRC